MEELRHLKYYLTWEIVNCADFGVPQNRKRLVLLASKYGKIKLIDRQYNETNYRTVRDAIENLPYLEDGGVDEKDPLHRASKLSK